MTEKEKLALEETLSKLEQALNSSDCQKIKDYTNALVEQTDGITIKVKMVSQARTLASAVDKTLCDKTSGEERREIAETIWRLEQAPYRRAEKEMNKLREMISLLEAKQLEKIG